MPPRSPTQPTSFPAHSSVPLTADGLRGNLADVRGRETPGRACCAPVPSRPSGGASSWSGSTPWPSSTAWPPTVSNVAYPVRLRCTGPAPGRRHDPPRRKTVGNRQAGTRRRQDGLLQAALAAAGGAAARNRPHARAPTRCGSGTSRRLLARTPRTVNALLALERTLFSPRPTTRCGVPRLRPAPSTCETPSTAWNPAASFPSRPRPSKADLPPATRPGRRPRAAGRHAQARREARPRPAGRLALDIARRSWPACWPSRSTTRVPAHETPRRVRPRDPPAGGAAASPSPTGGWRCWPAGTAPPSAWRGGGGASPHRRRSSPTTGATSPAGRSRQLLRNIEHTAAVHGFWRPWRASPAPWDGRRPARPAPPGLRHFRHERPACAPSTPTPSASCGEAPTTWPFFLEWERRAVRPATMSQRLAPYLRYYSSHRPTDDHGARPDVLVVFDDDIAATHFLRVAAREMRAAGVTVPLWVSHREAIDALGPLGRAWRTPATGNPPRSCPWRRERDAAGREGAAAPALFLKGGPSNHDSRTNRRTERPPEASGTDRRPAQHGGPLGAAGPAEPLPELARPGDRGQPRLRLHAGQRRARALGTHPQADAQGPRRASTPS